MMVAYWACTSCGRRVSNTHTGPCLRCGGPIHRVASTEVPLPADQAAHGLNVQTQRLLMKAAFTGGPLGPQGLLKPGSAVRKLYVGAN